MWVKQLQVLDFRNYERGEVAFEPGPNVLVGANGHGKTNLVEAVGYLATLSSHRVSSDTPLVRRDQARAFIRAVVVNDGRELLLELEINPGRANRAKLNRSAVPRVRDIAGLVRTVLFAPEDLELVRGDPGERRRFLDDLLVVRTPRFAGVRQDYDRVLRQRNTLLRTAGFARRAGRSGDLRTLEVWDGQLARTGAELLVGRRQLVADLRPFVEEAYAVVSGAAEPAGLAYRSSVEVDDGAGDNGPADDAGTAATDVPPIDAVPTLAEAETALLEALARVGAAEVERGVTLVGPHRDELVLSLDGYPAKGFASHGQSWSVALALRLASYDLLRGEGPEPVLVLDDVFAELDVRRREQLATLALGAEQTLITAAVASDVPESLRARTLHVVSGRVTNPLDPP